MRALILPEMNEDDEEDGKVKLKQQTEHNI
jgi:hypothetical protein